MLVSPCHRKRMARERYAAALAAIFENLVPLDFVPMIDQQHALATNIRYLA